MSRHYGCNGRKGSPSEMWLSIAIVTLTFAICLAYILGGPK